MSEFETDFVSGELESPLAVRLKQLAISEPETDFAKVVLGDEQEFAIISKQRGLVQMAEDDLTRAIQSFVSQKRSEVGRAVESISKLEPILESKLNDEEKRREKIKKDWENLGTGWFRLRVLGFNAGQSINNLRERFQVMYSDIIQESFPARLFALGGLALGLNLNNSKYESEKSRYEAKVFNLMRVYGFVTSESDSVRDFISAISYKHPVSGQILIFSKAFFELINDPDILDSVRDYVCGSDNLAKLLNEKGYIGLERFTVILNHWIEEQRKLPE